MAIIACDVSYFQPAVTDAYPHPWLIFRCCDGDFADPNCDTNARWATKATAAGKMIGWTAYVVYRPGQNQSILNHVAGLPAGGHVMIDVESWPKNGQPTIRGDHSAEINQLANALAKTHPGRVWGYGNRGDLASIWPNRGSIPLVVASYGATKPQIPNMIGWQYTDGSWAIPGKPNVSAPFGACDHNELYVTAESTQSGHAVHIPKPASPEEDIDMLIIRNGTRSEIALLTGKGAQPLQDGVSVAALKAAGVKTAVLSERDYASLVRAGR